MSAGVSPGVSRIEGFSDTVFGFAVTLLVVSLQVPADYDEMMAAMRMLPAFAASFAILLLIWQEHKAFFRRYGIDDGGVLWLNGALLFVVLAYVYPLKFLMNLLLGSEGLMLGHFRADMGRTDMAGLMLLYGTGFIVVFGIFFLLHWRVQTLHARAGAAATYLRDLRMHKGAMLAYAAVGVLSVLVAGLWRHELAPAMAGMVYALTGLVQWLYYARLAPRLYPEVAAAPASAVSDSGGDTDANL